MNQSKSTVDAITVCVDYADYFACTVANKSEFDRWLVVTAEDDRDTVAVCEAHGIEYCFSERVRLDGGFHKGKAINDGLLHLAPQDWVALIDADTLLIPGSFRKVKQLIADPDCLYGAVGRIPVANKQELQTLLEAGKVEKNKLEHENLMIGFLQVWHSSARLFYSEESNTAGLDDMLFRNSFIKQRWKTLPIYALHLGPAWLNHKGRVSPAFR